MIKSFFVKFCLVFFLLFSYQENAYSAGAIVKFFQGLAKIFSKGADESTNVIKQSDEIFNIKKEEISKINESFGSNKKPRLGEDSIFNKSSNEITTFEASKISEIKQSNTKDLLELHGIKHGDNLIDIAENTQEFFDEDEAINVFRISLWIGRVFRISNTFNKPKEDRLLIKCNTAIQDFYFTADLSKNKKWLLLSGNIIDIKKQGYYSPQLQRQELYVIRDEENYIIFTTRTEEGKKFPTHYFIIGKDGSFVLDKNIYGTDSPNYIISNAVSKLEKSTFECKKLY